MTEAELINGCIANDRRCQNQLYRLYFPLMSKIAIRYYDNEDDAVASINLGFLKLLQNIHRYDSNYSLSTYLSRILINTILSDLRAKAKIKPLLIDDHSLEYEMNHSQNESEDQLAYNDIIKMIARLPFLHKSVFNLFVIDGYPHKEIAQLLVISETHSKWVVYDAKKRIIRMMQEQNESFVKLQKTM